MNRPAWNHYPEHIRSLAAQIERLEIFLGIPGTPPETEQIIIKLAHRLRNELSVHELSAHLARPGREASFAGRD